MKHNAGEFVTFIHRNFRMVQTLCRERIRFTRDDEIISFLQRFDCDDRMAIRLIGRMRELGVLRDRVGYWSPPNFLIEFLDQLAEQHSLASPKVIRGWVESLRDLVQRLLKCVDGREGIALLGEVAAIVDLVDEIADVLHNVVHTVEENCERIAKEVNDYRAIEDKQQMRDRLQRLVHLQTDYLTPVIHILDVNEDLFAATDEISNCCVRLQVRLAGLSPDVVDAAERLGREVVWLRQVTIGRAEEARRDLAPLVEAAARESKIATGVHKAIDQIRRGNWPWLDLNRQLSVNDDKNSMLFGDVGVEGFLQIASEASDPVPPKLPSALPGERDVPTTVTDLLDELKSEVQVDDLLAWILDRDSVSSMDEAMHLFHAVVTNHDRATASEEQSTYTHDCLTVSAYRWRWSSDTSDKSLLSENVK